MSKKRGKKNKIRGRKLPSSELCQALSNQEMIGGDNKLAKALAEVCRVENFPSGGRLMVQDELSDGVYFILSGRVQVEINKHNQVVRSVNHHVGEMATIEPFGRRSATVVALEETRAAVVSPIDFLAICERFPKVWKPIAITLNRRLRDRAKNIRVPNEIPRLFIASSSEFKKSADKIRGAIHGKGCYVRVWADRGVFRLSRPTIAELEKESEIADFALVILSPDDILISGGRVKSAARDNLIFEHGLFSGTLKSERTFFVVPSNIDLKLPSDLAGMTQIRVPFGKRELNRDAINEIVRRVRYGITSLGSRTGYVNK